MRDKGMSINNKEYCSLMFVEIRLELELKHAFTESFKLLLLMFISSLGYTRNKKLFQSFNRSKWRTTKLYSNVRFRNFVHKIVLLHDCFRS